MQVQALPGASLHDGREQVEREDRGELRLSASVTDALVSLNRTLVVVKCRVKLPGSRITPLSRRELPAEYRDIPREGLRERVEGV